MKWGKKKKQSFSASSRPFLISHVLPTSWITKFKQMGMNPGKNDPKLKQKGKWNSVPANSSACASDKGKFYGRDGDAFWRLSFGEADEKLDGLKSRAILSSVQYNSDTDDGVEFLPSTCQNCTPIAATGVKGKEDAHSQKFNTVSRGKKIRNLPQNVENLPCAREKVAEIRTPRLRVEQKQIRRGNQRVSEEKQLNFEGRKDCCISPLNSTDPYQRKFGGHVCTDEYGSDIFSEESFVSGWQKLKERKIKELKTRHEAQRKSLYISRELQRKMSKQSSKVKTFSPRTAARVEIRKIKAFEDMKKSKLKMKKKAKEKRIEGFQGLESFAVAKCSYDPQKDFRESMIEMIKEKRISKPEELEELLACYLTLNSDEYHDLIIKVFRQVWLDMSQACFEFDTELDC